MPFPSCFVLFFLQEIPEFLSPEECDHIISLAKDSGLRNSTTGFSTFDGDLDEELAIAGEVAFKGILALDPKTTFALKVAFIL